MARENTNRGQEKEKAISRNFKEGGCVTLKRTTQETKRNDNLHRRRNKMVKRRLSCIVQQSDRTKHQQQMCKVKRKQEANRETQCWKMREKKAVCERDSRENRSAHLRKRTFISTLWQSHVLTISLWLSRFLTRFPKVGFELDTKLSILSLFL